MLSSATHLYFDHPHEPDPLERGYYWAPRFINSLKVFGFMPDRFYDNIDVDRFGNALNKESICETHGCPTLMNKDNLIGRCCLIQTAKISKEHGLI